MDRFESETSQRPLWKVAIGVVALAVVVWVAGLIVFVRKPAQLSFAFPVLEAQPAALHNLVLYRYGTHVRVSSFDYWSDSQHHPAFLVDDLKHETIEQKWATRSGDQHPWVELRWGKPATLERISIRHAGTNETQQYTARNYRMTCLTAQGKGTTLKISGNEEAETSHQLKCDAAVGIRLDFSHHRGADIVRVFEVQAWGILESNS